METIPYWKNLYQSLSGRCENVGPDEANSILEEVDDEILLGLAQYKPYTPKTFDEWKEGMDLDENKADLEMIIKRISKSLNLDCKTAWSLFCNFLMFEYYGKVEDIQEVVKYEVYIQALVDKILHFYTCERFYIIKTLRCVIDNHKNVGHKLYETYKAFVDRHTIISIRSHLHKQFIYSINEITIELSKNCLQFKDWIERNNQEQIEVLLTIISTLNGEEISMLECIDMMETFQTHGYTLRPPDYFEALHITNTKTISVVQQLEFAAFILSLTNFWGDTSKWIDYKDDMEKILQPEISPILSLVWIMLMTTLDHQIIVSEYEVTYKRLVASAIHSNVFEKLHQLVTLPVLKNTPIENLLKEAVYEMLLQICLKFNETGFVYSKLGTVELFAELLKVPEIAKKAMHVNCPVYDIFESARSQFPADFRSFTRISHELLAYPEYAAQIFAALDGLESFSEEYNVELSGQQDQFKIASAYKPYKNEHVIIPEDTYAQISRVNQIYIKFIKVNYSYYHILEEQLNTILNKGLLINDPELNNAIDNVMTGLDFLLKLLELDAKTILSKPELKTTINYILYLSSQYTIGGMHLLKLNSKCLEITTAMMPLCSVQVIQVLSASMAIPNFHDNEYDLAYFFRKNIVENSNMLQMIIHESAHDSHELFYAYVQFINESINSGRYRRKLQIPALIFLLHNVFPTHINWVYKDAIEKNRISHIILTIFKNFLQREAEEVNESERLLIDLCIETFFNYEGFIKSFVNILRTSNYYIENRLCLETNWDNGEHLEIISTVKLCITIILLAFNVKSGKDIKITLFWKYFFYSGSNYPSIIKIITDYINHKFDPVLPKLACVLLKKISMDPSVPVLAHLEMNNYQVQCMFLERLRDSLENDDLKVGLLDFITTCIKTQDGMTAAFFNLSVRKSVYKKKAPPTMGEAVTGFMTEYLENIEKSSEYLQYPLQSSILDLFHTIWIHKKTILITKMVAERTFWRTLAKPLFQDSYTLSNITYSQIIEIMAMQVAQAPDASLKMFIKVMFNDTDFNACFPQYIKECLANDVNDADTLILLKSWQMLLVFVIKNQLIEFTDECKLILIETTIEGLLDHLKDPKDGKIIACWSEIYLYLITHWGPDCYKREESVFKLLSEALHYYGKFYDNITNRTRETINTIAYKSVQHYAYLFEQNLFVLEGFLIALAAILDKEAGHLVIRKSNPECTITDNMPLVLLIMTGRELLRIGGDAHDIWFTFTQFVKLAMDAIGHFMQREETLTLAKVAMNCLIDFAKADFGRQFLQLEMDRFQDETRPKDIYLDLTQNISSAKAWFYEELWLTYDLIMQFHLILINKFGYHVFRTMLGFLYFHKDPISWSLKLPQITAQKSALCLASVVIQLVHKMLNWRHEWFGTEQHLFITYINIIADCLNSCINIFLRPKRLKYLTFDDNAKVAPVEEDVPLEMMANTMNRVSDIVSLVCLCYLQLTPHILDWGNYRQLYYINLESKFQIPDEPITDEPSSLTFGGIFCLSHSLCKTLTQIQLKTTNDGKPKLAPKRHSTHLELDNKDVYDNTKSPSIIFVYPDFIACNNRFNSIQRFANSEIYNLSVPWLALLNEKRITFALETLTTLLATQMLKVIARLHSNPIRYQMLKRDLNSEVQFFHDFIRKKMIDQHRFYSDGKNIIRNRNYDKSSRNHHDGDYLLMLSHCFMVICDLGNY